MAKLERASHEAGGGLGRLPHAAGRRGHAEEFERDELGVGETLERAPHAAESHRRRRAHVGLTEIGVDDADRVAGVGEGTGEAGDERRLAGVVGAQHECDPSGRRRLEGGRPGRAHCKVASAAAMRARPSLISASLVA